MADLDGTNKKKNKKQKKGKRTKLYQENKISSENQDSDLEIKKSECADSDLEMDTLSSKDTNIDIKKLKCHICVRLIKHPKMLECMHTFCLECLQQCMKENNKKLDGEKTEEEKTKNTEEVDNSESKLIICPKCQEITQVENGATSLPTDYVMENLIEKYENPNPEFPNCGECDDDVSKKFCQECKLALCGTCAHHHLKVKRYSRHHLESIENVPAEKIQRKQQYCEVHDELLKYFCKQCSVLVCHDCTVSKTHSNHERGLIDEVLQEKQDEVKNLIEKGNESKEILKAFLKKADNFYSEAEEHKKNGSKVIGDVFDAVINNLNERKKVLMNKLCTPFEKSSAALEIVKKKEKILQDTIEYGEKLLQSDENDNLEALAGIIMQLEKYLAKTKVEEKPEEHLPQPEHNGSNYTDQHGQQHYQDSNGKSYYQDPATSQWYRMLLDGVYYQDEEKTQWFQLLFKRSLTDAKVGEVNVSIQRVEAVSNLNINYKTIEDIDNI